MELRLCPRHKFCKGKIAENLSIRYCTKCQLAFADFLIEHPTLLHFQNKDILFIFEHPEGCTVRALSKHLKMSKHTFKGHIDHKRIHVAWEKRDGKFVHKFLDFGEMVRVINLAQNWVPLHQISLLYHQSYEVLRKYAACDYFGPIRENLSKHQSVHTSVLPDIEKRFQRAKNERHAKQGNKNHFLADDEFCLSTVTCWFSLSEGTLWRYYKRGYFRGRPVKKMVAVNLREVKRFILKVAGGRVPVDFNLFRKGLECSPLYDDAGFVRAVKRVRRVFEKNLVNSLRNDQFSRTLKGGELTAGNIREILGVSHSTLPLWFQKGLIKSRFDGRMYITTVEQFKEFLLDVYAGKVDVKRKTVAGALSHPLLKNDPIFMEKLRSICV